MIYPLLAALQLLVQLKYIHLASAAPRAHSHWRLRLVILIMGRGGRFSSLMALPMVIGIGMVPASSARVGSRVGRVVRLQRRQWWCAWHRRVQRGAAAHTAARLRRPIPPCASVARWSAAKWANHC